MRVGLALVGSVGLAQMLSGGWADLAGHLKRADTLYVLNFWATWCRPCVAELPYFQAAAESLAGKYPIRFWLVSLDFPPEGGKAAAALLARKSITLPAFWLTEKDPNVWIPNVNPDWDGAIPYTYAWPKGPEHAQSFSSATELVNFVIRAYDTRFHLSR